MAVRATATVDADGRLGHALGTPAGGEHRVLVDLPQADRLVADVLERGQHRLVVELTGLLRTARPQLAKLGEVDQVGGVPCLDGLDDPCLARDGDVVLRPAEPLEELRLVLAELPEAFILVVEHHQQRGAVLPLDGR